MEPLYVVGAGGIGCAVGYAFRLAGFSPAFVDADPAKVAWGREHGVAVDRRPPLSAQFVPFDQWQPEPGSTVLLCTKCYDNAAVLSRLPDPVRLVPIQNGFDPATGKRGCAGEGIASFVSECTPGRTHTRITRTGRLHFAFRSPPALSGLGRFYWHASRLGFPVEVVPDILPFKYTKLMYNAAISPLAAAAGIDNGQLLGLPKARGLFFRLLQENYGILREAGVPLGKVGPLHPHTVARILGRPAVANALAWAFYPSLRNTYCSMSGDLPAGRTEIEYYNRHLIDLAGARPCPLNRQVYSLVKTMERERIPPAVGVLNHLV